VPRPRKTQAPQTPGLEAGAAYGEVSDSLESQAAIPLPQKPPAGSGPAPAGSAAPPVPQASPVDAARGFNPQITPLLAPGENRPLPAPVLTPTPKQNRAVLLQSWAAATGDPIIMAAASQLLDQ